MTEYLIVLIIGICMGICTGYLMGSVGARYQRTKDIQELIDIQATQRKADGLSRRGDIETEYEPSESSAGVARILDRCQK